MIPFVVQICSLRFRIMHHCAIIKYSRRTLCYRLVFLSKLLFPDALFLFVEKEEVTSVFYLFLTEKRREKALA